MKRRTSFAAALVGALALSGCTEIGAISQQTQIDVALSGLVSTLASDHGVTALTDKVMDADYRFSVTVTVAADGIDRSYRDAVISTVDHALGGSAFDNTTAWFTIGTDLATVFSQSRFGADTLQSDLEYWSEVEAAVGDVSFSISDDPDGDGPLTRARGIYSPTPIDYGALAGVALDATALDSWGSPGVSASGTLPSAQAVGALTELAAMIPLRDYADPGQALGISLDWLGDTATWHLSSSSLQYNQDDLAGTDPAASADWRFAVEAASRIAGAGIHRSQFAYLDTQNLGGMVWFGDCGTELQANALDETLFAALQTAGVAMPAGSAPGWCSGG